MRTAAVVGMSFGDEGKGLAVDWLAQNADRPLVVRHNGGSQSGHTVEREGKRFVFHALSSGSLAGADTLWIGGFYPDLYKLGEELADFRAAFGCAPRIFAAEQVCVTVPDDVLLNMALEASRGEARHGSCGMGINECVLRTAAGFGLPLRELALADPEALFSVLSRLRRDYTTRRLRELDGELNAAAAGYLALLKNENVLYNAAQTMCANARNVTVLSESSLRELLAGTGTLIFETGQGLLLDKDNLEYAPHVTASNTGLEAPCVFLAGLGLGLDEAVYVSRSYVTRHGAGRLSWECPPQELGRIERDRTNEANEWQGRLRYAPHESVESFSAAMLEDLGRTALRPARVSLFLTHLNETGGCVVLRDRRVPVEDFIELPRIRACFDTFYLSASRFSGDVIQRP